MQAIEAFGIAIIGIAGRFPQAHDLKVFWEMLKNGREGLTTFSNDELLAEGINASLLQHPNYVKTGSVIPEIEYFDADFFDMSAQDAKITDPQQRLFMECAWQALEQAGYLPATIDTRIGLYTGVDDNTYHQYCLAPNMSELLQTVGAYRLFTLSGKDYIATRTAYKLNLTGPAMSVQTACSTSLVAVHVACQSLLNFECNMALAGGASVRIPQKQGYVYQDGMIFSPDGHCRTFDARSQGTVGGSGIGVVLLKRLDEAMADGDTIYAVIRGSAINNDGADKIGYTAPSVSGQTNVILEAQIAAGVHPDEISYIEAHGTATSLGDPIEIQALTQAFRTNTDRTGYCAIGSVKSNIGHASTAAGIAGLIKTVLALKHRMLPPSLHFEQPNPQIDFANSPFFVNTQLREWETTGNTLRCAGVSSFGIGGTNAHVIVAEAPPIEPSGPSRPIQLFTLSAKTTTALDTMTRNLAQWLRHHPNEPLPDVAYTLNRGRQSFAWRRTVTGTNVEEVCQQLDNSASPAYEALEKAAEVVFLFPGQGSQYPQMTRGLYDMEPLFRKTLDHCATLLIPHLGVDLREVLYSDNTDSAKKLKQTRFTQPALFAVEYALAKLWMAWGIQPKAMLGHSIGEYTVACLAGVFSLEDALMLVATRGKLIQSLPPGAMLAVPLSEPAIQPWLSPNLSLAAINSAERCVIGGIPEAIANLQKELQTQGIESRTLHTSHAFHSHLLEPILDDFAQKIGQIQLNPPIIPYLSNLTGIWIRPEQVTNPDYWVHHLRNTVRFADNIQALLQEEATVLLETGPSQTLSTLVQQYPGYSSQFTLLHSLPGQRQTVNKAEISQLLATLGHLWASGVIPDWDAFYADEKRHRLPLPTYPFERRKYWIDPPDKAHIVSKIVSKDDAQVPITEPEVTQQFESIGDLSNTLSTASSANMASPRPVSAKPYVAPCTLTEMQLAEIWPSFLGIAPIGIEDDFFELGGDSLLATQLAARIQDRFNINMPLQILFDNPVLSDLAAWLEQQQRGDILPPIETPAADDPLVLSYAQQRLWFLAQLEGPSATYNLPAALDISGLLDIQALENTFVTLVQRHQSLRLSFPEVNGKAILQEIPAYNPFVVSDLSQLPTNEQNAEVQRLTKEHADNPFDIASGPLLRLHLLILSEQHAVLLFNIHHIIFDGWSMNVLIREWVNLYDAFSQNQNPNFKPLTIQYSDYAAWQRNWLQGEMLQQQLHYWTEQLSGAPGLLELPADYPRPAVQSYQGAQIHSQLSSELTHQLKQLSQQQGVTLFMTLLAAFNVLLHRYSGQEDILIGSPIANRTNSQTEHLIGFFVNTLVLRTQIQPRTSFTELLKHTKQITVRAYAHQDIPFEYLVEQLKPERSLSHSPLFQVMFVLQNNPQTDLSLPGLDIRFLPQESPVAKFDLTVNAVEISGKMAFFWEYASDLFQVERIQRMAEHFAILLQGIVNNPEANIYQLPLLTEAETRQIIEWNRMETNYPKEKTIVNLFEEQVVKKADNIAVVFESQQLTYAELNQQANRLAHYLRTLITIDNCLIAICVERSLDMIVGLLGILKAGGAYVPLDPDYPPDRLTYMLQDSEASILLTQNWLQDRLLVTDARIVYLDEPETFDRQPDDNPTPISEPEDLAYVIYTSGSTGWPKGCLMTHHNVVRLFAATEAWYHFDASDVWTLFHSYGFDFSVWELWGALCYGGKLVVVPYFTSRNPEDFLDLLVHQRVTVLNQTPSAFRQLIEADKKHSHQYTLKWIIFGGEALEFSALEPWFAKHGDQHPQLVNMYGITETAVHVTFYPLTQQQIWQPSSVIGKPLPDLCAYILDAYNQLVPIGIPGELHITGAGLARGYLNRPELTAEKFIEIELFGDKQRVYKTGDLACWRPNGNLEYLCRIDNQVKIRGFRIELGEIEAVLIQHEAVREAVTVVCERAGNKALAAYITIHDDKRLIDNSSFIIDLRAWLKTRLPDHMVPVVLQVSDALPLTPNGKVDRNALEKRAAKETLALDSISYVAPRTAEEKLIANIWADVLNLERVSIHDNFFELGGHSLLATQVISRLHHSFEQPIEISVRTLFEAPILTELAELLALAIACFQDTPEQNEYYKEVEI